MEQKKFDFNSFIGMILLGGIILWWMNTNQPETETTTDTKTSQVVDSTKTNTLTNAVVNETAFENDSIKKLALTNKLGAFAQSAITGSEGFTILENSVLKLTINNKGGQIKEALIKIIKHMTLYLYI